MGRDDFFLWLEQKIWWYFLQRIAWCFSQSSLENLDETWDNAAICWDLWVQSDVSFLLGFGLDPMLYFCFFSGLSPQNFNKVDFCFLDVEDTKEFVGNFQKNIPFFPWCKYQCLQQKSPRIPYARDFFSPSLRSSVAGKAAYNLRLQLTCGKAGS